MLADNPLRITQFHLLALYREKTLTLGYLGSWGQGLKKVQRFTGQRETSRGVKYQAIVRESDNAMRNEKAGPKAPPSLVRANLLQAEDFCDRRNPLVINDKQHVEARRRIKAALGRTILAVIGRFHA